jgi:glycosyltransferase involved in cell wall biosynthesis
MPRVSVVIPTFNRATLVCEAIDSVLGQAITCLEVIVVDDGSTDGTGEIIRSRYGERIRYLCQPNTGRSVARNRGIGAASGQYLLFLDSDDLLLPRALERESAYLDARPDVDVVYTDGYFCDADGQNLSRIASARPVHRPENILEDLVTSNVILACHSAMVRRAALDTVGPPYFDPELRGTEDADLWVRLAAHGCTFAYLDVLTCRYRIHASNASRYDPSSPAYWRRRESVKRCRFKILQGDFFPSLGVEARERFFYSLLLFQTAGDEQARAQAMGCSRFLELPAGVRARLLYYLGVRSIVTNGELAPGRGYLREAVRLMPANLKYRTVFLLSHLGCPLLARLVTIYGWLRGLSQRTVSSSPIGPGGIRPV